MQSNAEAKITHDEARHYAKTYPLITVRNLLVEYVRQQEQQELTLSKALDEVIALITKETDQKFYEWDDDVAEERARIGKICLIKLKTIKKAGKIE